MFMAYDLYGYVLVCEHYISCFSMVITIILLYISWTRFSTNSQIQFYNKHCSCFL